jgi:hypothetical protein
MLTPVKHKLIGETLAASTRNSISSQKYSKHDVSEANIFLLLAKSLVSKRKQLAFETYCFVVFL